MFWITLGMHLTDLLIQNHAWTPTGQQAEAFGKIGEFIEKMHPGGCFILRGYAGTGKTTIISTLVRSLPTIGLRTVLLAPTGRAAKVMSQYAERKALTIHKKIYRKKQALSLSLAFSLAQNPHENTIFIVDEASMISDARPTYHSESLLEDLIEYVQSGKACSLLLVGDTAQLPPVGYTESPALNEQKISSGFGLHTMAYELQEVVRQAESSGILINATRIREKIQRAGSPGSIGLAEDTGVNPSATATVQPALIPKFTVRGYPDIFRMSGERLIEGLNYAYDKYGMDHTLVVCRSNKAANLYNKHIRHDILFRDEELSGGDLIMVVRNNYYWLAQEDPETTSFIANGEMAQVRRVRNIHEQYGFRFADVTLEFSDMDETEAISCRVILDTLHTDTPNLSREDQALLYERILEDYGEEAKNSKAMAEHLRTDPYYNALQIKFAMAITCHKAQGGQWHAVFVDQGFVQEENIDQEFLRWLYTACTRATKELFLVNFDPLFFSTD